MHLIHNSSNKCFIFQRLSDTCSWLTLTHFGSSGASSIVCPPPENENCGSNQPSCFAPSLTLHRNYLRAPCPLTEALSRGNAGNQINCMSANRITSSLTRHESALKLVTHARENGRVLGGEPGGGLPSRRGTPSAPHASSI